MKHLYTFGIVSLLLASCGGEFSYKQGASAQDLTAAKSECKRDGVASPTDIALCLENKGWHVSQLDDQELFAEASVTENNRNGATTKDENSAFVLVKKEAEGAPTVQSSSESQPSKVAESTSKTVPTAKPKAKKSVSQSTNKDPMTIYKVSSWWKFGSSGAMLERDTNACVTALGEAHKPNYETQAVTRGLVVCLYKKGWKALKAK